MTYAYLGLGSNVGDRLSQLEQAIEILDHTENINVTQVSPVYETEPVGYVEQPQFLNLCIEVETSLTPKMLLQKCLQTEHQLHRVRDIRWGPRTLDVDILLYGDDPRMFERAFVLIPLNDIAGAYKEPRSHKTIEELVIPDDSVKKYKA